MKVSRKLVLCLALVVSVAMATGGTLAYLTDTDSTVNVMTLGNVDIEQKETDRNGDDFKQDQPLLPTIRDEVDDDGDGYWDNKNVIDKTVSVTNTGSTDAYVRTLYAFEIGTMAEEYLNIKWDDSVTPERLGTTVINGETYVVYSVTYPQALAPDVTVIGLKQFALDYTAGNEQVNAVSSDADYQILVVAQAMQVGGFDDAASALNEGFGAVTTAAEAAPFFGKVGASAPAGDSDAFKDALESEASNIVINLTGDVIYDVAAWKNNAMGGTATETITINGNGYTITFNHTDGDWNNIVTDGAVLNIKDAHLTNSGYNDSAWNRHDLNFGCEVNLTNVTSDKAMAFMAGANLENVTINDANTDDTYAIWIQPNGQTVTLNNCTIDMLACTDGRGIKIDEQYVDDPQKVTLNVSNTTFKTEEKSAIIVKSEAGADINLSNVDISGVAADPKHEVWVDEASKNYYDLVTVVGGTKVLEGDFTSLASGLYKEGNTYYVSSASGLKWLSNKTLTSNNSVAETAIINLEADIDMKNEAFSAVIAQRGDTLIFNGNGHTISNVEVVSGADDNTTGQASMFYVYPYSNLEVSNLTLANITVTSDAVDSGYAAAVVGYCEGTAKLTDVDVSNAKVNGVKSSGMLVGHLSGVLVATNCDMSGTVELVEFSEEPDGHYAGKYIGTLAGAAQLNYCTADVDVIGKLKAGNDGTIYGRKTEAGSLMN